MSKSNWAEEDSDEDQPDVTPEQLLEEKLLDQVDRNRGSAPQRENRSRSGSNVSGGGGGGDRSRNRGHRDQAGSYGRGGGGEPRGNGYQNYRGGDGYDRYDGRGGDRAPMEARMEAPKNGPFIAYVGNLNYATTAQTIGEYFQGGGCDVTDVKILTERDGRPRGYANVTFSDRESLVAAMEANGTDLEGRSISVRVDRRAGSDRQQRRGYGEGRDEGPSAADGNEAWGRGARSARPEREPRERKEREPRASDTPKTRPVLNLAARTVPVDSAPVDVPRASSIFGDATPVTVKEKEIKPKSKPRPRTDREGEGRTKDGPPKDGAKDKKDKPQRSDGAWTKEKVGEGGKKILQRDNAKKDKRTVSHPHFPAYCF